MKHRFNAVVERARGPGASPPFSSSTYPWKGEGLYVGLPKAERQAAGLEVGDAADFEIEVDARPREFELPPELEAAFDAEPDLRRRFDGLSWSRKRLIFEPVADAKKLETRAARLEKALADLGALP